MEAPSFKDVAPRFNVVWDVNGDGRTAVKFSANRYHQPIAVQIIERLNPLAGGNNLGQASSVTNQRQWLPQSRCNDAGVLGCDRNGDLIPQLSEIGPSPGYVLQGVNAFYDPTTWSVRSRTSTASNFSASSPTDAVVSASFVRSETRRNIGNRNTAAPPSTWIGPTTVTEVTSGRDRAGVESRHRGRPFLNYNYPNLDPDFHGVDVTLNKRMSNRWSMPDGAASELTPATPWWEPQRSERNGIPVRLGRVTVGDRPWSYRMSGVYQLPFSSS